MERYIPDLSGFHGFPGALNLYTCYTFLCILSIHLFVMDMFTDMSRVYHGHSRHVFYQI